MSSIFCVSASSIFTYLMWTEKKLFKKIVVVTNNFNQFKGKKYLKFIKIIKGGKERSDSSLNALKYLKRYNPHNVFIHDAARPNFSTKLLGSILKNMKNARAVVPKIKIQDAIKQIIDSSKDE